MGAAALRAGLALAARPRRLAVYPSMRLFRQAAPGERGPVVRQLRASLQGLIQRG